MFLIMSLSFAGKEPVDKYFRRVGMGQAVQDAERSLGCAHVDPLFERPRLEPADRQALLHARLNFAGRRGNGDGEFPHRKPVHKLAPFTRQRNLHLTKELSYEFGAQIRMVKCKLKESGRK